VERRQAYIFELCPNVEQIRLMRQFGGHARFVYNKALALQKERYEKGEKRYTYVDLAKQLTAWRHHPETAWLADAPVHPLQQKLKDLDRAYVNFFEKRAGFPTFKKKQKGDSFRYPDSKQFKVDQNTSRIFLPKLGWLRYRKSQEILGVPKNITVRERCGKWFAAVQTEREVETPIHPSVSSVGVDVGIAQFATLSNGEVFASCHSLKKHADRLARLQRSLSRKKKYSKNWFKTKRLIQRLHRKIADIRRDHIHKVSHAISKNHAMVFVEDLCVKNMSKSASGSVESPGKNVRAKSGLNRSILDQGWGEFRRQLEYKSRWCGGEMLAVNPRNTSITCPEETCGHRSKENRPTQAVFKCVRCGYENHADWVGAVNILRAGHAQLACRDTSFEVGTSAQEPTEVTLRKMFCA
jgi:putative transposase